MNPAGAGNKRNTPPRPAAVPGSHTWSQSPEVPATGTDRRPPCQHLTGLRSACTKLLRAGIAAIVRPRDGHQETINEINKTRRNAAIAVKACRGRQARVASDALPVSRGRAGPRRPAPAPGERGPGGPPSPGPARHVCSRHWLPSGVSKSPSGHAAARYRRRSCRGWYHTDRQRGAWQYTTRWPTDQPPRLGKEGLAKPGKIR